MKAAGVTDRLHEPVEMSPRAVVDGIRDRHVLDPSAERSRSDEILRARTESILAPHQSRLPPAPSPG